jgi:lysozyme family protein
MPTHQEIDMDATFERALSAVLKHEGGYVNHKDDPGGPTNLGITLANFRRFVKPKGTIEDLKALTKAQAAVVYQRQYWDAVLGSRLPAGVDYAAFDFAVNSGPKRASQFLQRIVGTTVDGVIGPKTLAAVAAKAPAEIIAALCDARLAWLKTLKTWPTFGRGWGSRVKGVRALALEMAAARPVETATQVSEAPVTPAPETPATGDGNPSGGINWGKVALAVAVLAAVVAVLGSVF